MKSFFNVLVSLLMCLLVLNCNKYLPISEVDAVKNSNLATKPYTNYLFASNASIPGRIGMTLRSKHHKPCINTATSFYNPYHTCSNCEDFVKSPETWGFEQVTDPKVGDMIIMHKSDTGRAYHAAIIVNIKDGKYYINHAVRTNYYKNVELKTASKLAFYRYKGC